MEVSGQLHDHAVLPQGKSPRSPLGPRTALDVHYLIENKIRWGPTHIQCEALYKCPCFLPNL
jgi:hypothetical protein